MSDKSKSRAAKAAELKAEHERAAKRQRNIITAAVIAVVVVLIGVAFYAVRTASDANSVPYTEPANMTADFGFVVTPEDFGGTSDNPAEVVIYEDMQCPACAALASVVGGFLTEQLEKGTITLETRIVSFLDRASTNQYSSRAANAAACVWDTSEPAAFKRFQDALFAAQPVEGGPGPENAALGEAALAVGASADSVKCINEGIFAPWVEKAYVAFGEAGYNGTPTVLIDGKQVTGKDGALPNIADFEKAIAAARK